MASISTRNGNRVLQATIFGKRLTCSLGPISKAEAEIVRNQVNRLIACRQHGVHPDPELTAWTRQTTGRLRELLVKAGFARQTLTLGEYLAQDTSQTPARKRIRRLLSDVWGDSRPVHSIIGSDGQDLRERLSGSENTIRAKLAAARSVMSRAVRDGLLANDPFEGMATGQKRVPDRKVFVERSVIDAILERTADPELRLIICLGRYAGLRIPSELRELRWGDVDWERQRFTVTAPKTNTTRTVPIFPELSGPFTEAFEAASEGAEFVLLKYRDNPLARILKRLVKRAGLKCWPKPWHSLRASRETELLNEYPIHAVCAWIGNSPLVALRHYALIRESDFHKAVGIPDQATAEKNADAHLASLAVLTQPVAAAPSASLPSEVPSAASRSGHA